MVKFHKQTGHPNRNSTVCYNNDEYLLDAFCIRDIDLKTVSKVIVFSENFLRKFPTGLYKNRSWDVELPISLAVPPNWLNCRTFQGKANASLLL
jgi:hypothetical protein